MVGKLVIQIQYYSIPYNLLEQSNNMYTYLCSFDNIIMTKSSIKILCIIQTSGIVGQKTMMIMMMTIEQSSKDLSQSLKPGDHLVCQNYACSATVPHHDRTKKKSLRHSRKIASTAVH